MFTPTSLSFTYTKASLYALSKLQFSLVRYKFKFVYQLVCIVLVLLGALTSLPENIRMVMLMIGCVAFPCMYLPVRMATERVSAHYGSKLPSVSYRFNQYNFIRTIDKNDESFSYKNIAQLIEDNTNCYIVDNNCNVFILPPAEIGNDRGLKNVKAQLSEQTGLKWGQLRSMWSLSIYSLKDLFKR
ncbi:hypothetical protein RFF05_01750 [Bengtsoniella intestinalis]|uniref:hypothetical protein n=1 Tax=Bengtsoniella intestinalis TaxID=3073143 RepID=UPI00391EEC34